MDVGREEWFFIVRFVYGRGSECCVTVVRLKGKGRCRQIRYFFWVVPSLLLIGDFDGTIDGDIDIIIFLQADLS